MTDAALALLLPLLKTFEGCRLSAYMPTPNDRPTIGYGSTFFPNGTPVVMGDVVTQVTADIMLESRARRTLAAVAFDLGATPTTDNQAAAMSSLCYNIGGQAFGKSTVLRLHRLGDHKGAAAAFVLFDKQGHKVLPGLLARRRREATLYLAP